MSRARRASAPAGFAPFIKCSICLEVVGTSKADGVVEKLTTTLCRHSFGDVCLKLWAASKGNDADCPECRQLLDGRASGTLPQRILDEGRELLGGYDRVARHEDGYWVFEIDEPGGFGFTFLRWYPDAALIDGGIFIDQESVEEYEETMAAIEEDRLFDEEVQFYDELRATQPDDDAFWVDIDASDLPFEEKKRLTQEHNVKCAAWLKKWCKAVDGPTLTMETDFKTWAMEMLKFIADTEEEEEPNEREELIDFISKNLCGFAVSELPENLRTNILNTMKRA